MWQKKNYFHVLAGKESVYKYITPFSNFENKTNNYVILLTYSAQNNYYRKEVFIIQANE